MRGPLPSGWRLSADHSGLGALLQRGLTTGIRATELAQLHGKLGAIHPQRVLAAELMQIEIKARAFTGR